MELQPEEVSDLMDVTLCALGGTFGRAKPARPAAHVFCTARSPHPADEPKEIKSLYRRFRRLDIKGRGTISADDLTMIPEVHMNPLGLRLIAMFARDGEGRINFRAFALGLSVLSARARAEVKSEALFRVYDVDGDGAISGEDIRVMLLMATGKALSEAAVREVVAQTLAAGDRDGDGVIGLADWRAMPYAWDTFSVPVRRAERESYFLAHN